MTQNQFSTYSYRHSEPMIAHVGHNIGDVECILVGVDFDHEMFQLVPFDLDYYEDKVFWYHYKFVDKPRRKPKMKVVYGCTRDIKVK